MAVMYQTINGTAATNTAVILDWSQSPFNTSFAVTLLAGTTSISYGVQYTLDNPNAATDQGAATTTVTWFNDVNVGVGSTTNLAGNYMFPVRALRCNVATATATTIVQFAVIQGVAQP